MPWLLLVCALVAWLWWDTLGAKWAARAAARRACQKARVRFIDEVALLRMRPARDELGRFRIRRIYRFEFCLSGDVRYAGRVVMMGHHVAWLTMDPYPDPTST